MTSVSSKYPWLLRNETLRYCQRVFALVAVCAISFLLYRYRHTAAGLARTADISFIAAAVMVLVTLHAVVAIAFNCLHRALHVHRRLTEAMASYFARLPARYLPGGIWHTVSRYIDIHAQHGVDKRTFGILFFAETGVVAITGLLLGGTAGLLYIPASGAVAHVAQIMLVAALALTFVLLVAAMRARVRPILAQSAIAIVILAVNWIGLGIAFALYAHALRTSAFATCGVGVLAATYDMAASLGYVTIFAPQGWGVTELSFGTLQTCGAELPETVSMMAGFRIVVLIADVFAFALGLSVATASARFKRQRPNRSISD